MLFVADAADIHDFLPGVLPRSLQPFVPDPGTLSGTLCRELCPADRPVLRGTGPPVRDPGTFWSTWFLVAHAPRSHYDILRRVLQDRDAPDGHLVCLALSGRKFRGQKARRWQTVRGNLHLSLALKTDLAAAACGLALTMLPAVAVVDALKDLSLAPGPLPGLGIKWVNDILVGGRKLAGVLTWARSQEGRITACVLGLGLNVAVAPKVAPTPFTPGVTCLADHLRLPREGLRIVLEGVLTAVARRFEELAATGPGPLLEAYRASSLIMGREVEIHPDVQPAYPVRRGRVLAIGPDLSLTLDDGRAPVTDGRLALPPVSF
jgi:biotin-[acetyl-CoA-carboxylase] ligase BirA-like protein